MSESDFPPSVPRSDPAMMMTMTTAPTRRVKREGNKHITDLARWFLRNQIYVSFNIIAILFSIHACLPVARPYTSKTFTLSHYNSNTRKFGVGSGDFFLLGFCVTLFTGLRASCMRHLLQPLARQFGVSKKRDVIRFSEQAWILCYYSVFWTLGVYIYCTSDYFLNPREMFTNWPTRELPGLIKAYILGQWAFWLQQLIVINIEERRKDHWQMLAHHIVTIALIYTSYALHLARVANMVLVLMDVVDIFLPLAKCLKYLGFSTLRDIVFGIFMLSWFLARHVFYILNMYHIWVHMPETINIGCYHGPQDNLVANPTPLPEQGWLHMLEAFLNPSGTICYNNSILWGFLGALGFLQVLTVFWFFLILQVALRVVKGIGADDIRSDNEGGDKEGMEVGEVGAERSEFDGAQTLEFSVDAGKMKTWKRRTGFQGTASTSGVGFSGSRG